MAELLPGESLRDYQDRIRAADSQAMMSQLQSMVPGAPQSSTPTAIPPVATDIASRPYDERTISAKVIGAPVDAINEGMRAVGLPVSEEPVFGSKNIDRTSRLTVNEIAQTPAQLEMLAGVGQAAYSYLKQEAVGNGEDNTFASHLFTPEGLANYQQQLANKRDEFKRALPDASEADLSALVERYAKTEEGYRTLSENMTPMMRDGRLRALDVHKSLGLAGTPDDATYSDDALGIIGSSAIALPATPSAIGGRLAGTVVDKAYQKLLTSTITKNALKAAELLTPVTVPATQGMIAANAVVGLASNELLRSVTGQASLTGDMDKLYKEEADRVAAQIDKMPVDPSMPPGTDVSKVAGASYGPFGLIFAAAAGAPLAKHVRQLINGTPVQQTTQAVHGAGTASGAATTTINNALPSSTERTISDNVAAIFDESANVRREVHKLTGDEELAQYVDAMDQNLVKGGGHALDMSAIQHGVFSNGEAIKSVNYPDFMRNATIAIRRDEEKLTKYLNAKQELSVREDTRNLNYEQMLAARQAAQAKPNNLRLQNEYHQAVKQYQDTIDDMSAVGRHDFKASSNAELKAFINQVEIDPAVKAIADDAAKIGKELQDIRLRNGLITRAEYDATTRTPYYLRKMADYSKDKSLLQKVDRYFVKGLDYTQPGQAPSGRAFAGMTHLEYNKGAEGEIRNFANPLDAIMVGVHDLSRDIRKETYKRELISGLEAKGYKLKRAVYSPEVHGKTDELKFSDNYVAVRDSSTGKVMAYALPGNIARFVNHAPEAYSAMERVGNFWRAAIQRPLTGPLRGISSFVNQGVTAALSPLALAPGNVRYNPATIAKGIAMGTNYAAREAAAGTIRTVRSLLLNTPLFRAIDMTPNGTKVIDNFLTKMSARMQTSFMKTIDELGVSPTAMAHGVPVVGPNYTSQFKSSIYARGPFKEAYETWAKSFEYFMSGPRLAVLDDELSKQMQLHGVSDPHALPEKVLRRAIQDAREIEGDFMRNVGDPTLRKALSLIPYGRVTAQGNVLLAKRFEQMLTIPMKLADGTFSKSDAVVLTRMFLGGVAPKLVSLGLIAAAGKKASDWYWQERTDQQRMREWHFPKKIDDLIGLFEKMAFGTPYKDVAPEDFYIMRGPPDTAWFADAVVEGSRALLAGSVKPDTALGSAPKWYDPTMWQLLGRWATSAAGLDMPAITAIAAYNKGAIKTTEQARDENYLGARVQDVMTAALGLLGTAAHESVNTLAATKSVGKAAKEFDAQIGFTKPATGVSDVPMLLDAPTRYTRSNTLMQQVRATESLINSSSEAFLKQIKDASGRGTPIQISLKDLQNMKLIADSIHAATKQSGGYTQYDKAFDSFSAMARNLESVGNRRKYEPQQRIDMTQKLNRYAHQAAQKKIAILTDLERSLANQYGDYIRSKGYEPTWQGISQMYREALSLR